MSSLYLQIFTSIGLVLRKLHGLERGLPIVPYTLENKIDNRTLANDRGLLERELGRIENM